MQTPYCRVGYIVSSVAAFALAVGLCFAGDDAAFFNGKDLSGWEFNKDFWSVDNGEIVGHNKAPITLDELLFHPAKVADFYLSVQVKLTPDDRNSGIDFRSKPLKDAMTYGYQADIGKTFWGRLYHEAGRGKLAWGDGGEKHVKPGDWNHYEILASGDRVWSAINGQLAFAVHDPAGEREGRIGFQIHSGPPLEVRFRELKLVHNPELKLAGLDEKALLAALQAPEIDKGAPNVINPAAGFNGTFTLGAHETVVFTGGTNSVGLQWHPYFETILTSRFGAQKPSFRNMSWEADTVFDQPRELNFPAWPAQLEKARATVIFAQFGQMEALGGREKLPAFIDAYNKLLDVFSQQTKKIVLISPIPFESQGGGLPDLSARNGDLKLYVDAIRELAHARGFLYVDLFGGLKSGKAEGAPRLTTNGVHLTPYGQWIVALALARELQVLAPEIKIEVNAGSGKSSASGTALAAATANKNNVSFQAKITALPPPEFIDGSQRISHAAGKIKISGLSGERDYVLKIDGTEVLRAPAGDWRRGIQLNSGHFEKTGALQKLIQAKNADWFNYWRPSNWAFLHGDRNTVASSFDHRDPKVRWFPTEIEEFVKLINANEDKIFNLAQPATYRFEIQPAQ